MTEFDKKMKKEFGKEIYDKTWCVIRYIELHDNNLLSEECIWAIAKLLKEKEEETEKMVREMVGGLEKEFYGNFGYGYNQKRNEIKKIAGKFNYKI